MWIKIKIFPVILLAESVAGYNKILDFGCGLGLMSYAMKIINPNAEIKGIDIDSRKVMIAKNNISDFNSLEFETGGIEKIKGRYDCILISDVLYINAYDSICNILERCYDLLERNGLLIIKEMSKRPAYKYLVNYAQEIFAVNCTGFTKTEGSAWKKFYIFSENDMGNLLNRMGYTVQSLRVDKGYLYPHIIYKCKKI